MKSNILNVIMILIIMIASYASGIFGNITTKKEPSIDSVMPNTEIIEVTINPDKATKKVNYSELFSGIHLVPLETNPKCLLGNISQLKIVNDTIYVLDCSVAKSLYVFDIQGHFIRRVGRVGKGPGEYVSCFRFAVDKGAISIFDHVLQKIINYDNTGRFVQEFFLKHGNLMGRFAVKYGKDYLVETRLGKKEQEKSLLKLVDEKGKVKKNWLKLPEFNKGWNKSISYNNNCFNIQPDGIRYYNYFNDTIFTISPDHMIKPYIAMRSSLPLQNKDIEDFMKVFKADWPTDMPLRQKRKCYGISDYLENHSTVFFTYNINGGTQSVWMDKSTGDVKVCILCNDMVKDAFWTPFATCNNDSFVHFYRRSSDFESFKERASKGDIQICKENLRVLNAIKMDDNPVLFFYKLKK